MFQTEKQLIRGGGGRVGGEGGGGDVVQITDMHLCIPPQHTFGE